MSLFFYFLSAFCIGSVLGTIIGYLHRSLRKKRFVKTPWPMIYTAILSGFIAGTFLLIEYDNISPAVSWSRASTKVVFLTTILLVALVNEELVNHHPNYFGPQSKIKTRLSMKANAYDFSSQGEESLD